MNATEPAVMVLLDDGGWVAIVQLRATDPSALGAAIEEMTIPGRLGEHVAARVNLPDGVPTGRARRWLHTAVSTVAATVLVVGAFLWLATAAVAFVGAGSLVWWVLT